MIHLKRGKEKCERFKFISKIKLKFYFQRKRQEVIILKFNNQDFTRISFLKSNNSQIH